MAKVRLPGKRVTDPVERQVHVRVVSEITVPVHYLTGETKEYATIEDVIAGVESYESFDSWGEVLSDCGVWEDKNFTELELEWADTDK